MYLSTDEQVPKSTWRCRLDSLRILISIIAFQLLYLSVAFIAVREWPAMDTERFYSVERRWPESGEPTVLSHFVTWDAAHYIHLSEVGYVRGSPSCAFYPLFPLLIGFLGPIFGGNHVAAGLFIANAAGALGFFFFYRIVFTKFDRRTGFFALALLIAYPGAVFFHFIYTESIFLLLLMLLWFSLEEDCFALGLVAAFLLPLTRAVGVFSVLPIWWHVFGLNERLSFATGTSSGLTPTPNTARLGQSRFLRRAFLLAAPVVGWLSYLALMWFWTGNPFEGFVAQKNWGVHSVWNLINLPKFVASFFSPTTWHDFTGSFFDRCSFLVLIAVSPLIWKVNKELLVWHVFLAVIPAMSGEFTSYTRFGCLAFPAFLAVATYFTRMKRRFMINVSLTGLFCLQVLMLWMFLNFRWAG
jgi:hypothetical protein